MLTKEQMQKCIDLYEIHKNFSKCAKELGLDRRTFAYQYKKAVHVLEYNVEDPEVLKGTSTLYKNNPDGTKKQVMTWVKTNIDLETQKETLTAIFEGLKTQLTPLPKVKAPKAFEKDLMAEYILTDLHLGMLAEKSEVGVDWNIEIAKESVRRWLSHSINSAPNCEQAVFVQMGDFQHYSSMMPITPAHGNILDASSRPNKLVKAATELMCECIDTLLRKHNKVHVIIADANHDEYGQAAFRAFLPLLYKNEPRITIDDSESPFYCFEFGNVSCYYHHGHKKNIKDVSKVFASYFREIYGRTKYSYGRLGHLHHTARSEDNLMQVEVFPTLAPTDAYAHGKGYSANRGAVTVIHHKEYGEVQRITTSPNIVL